TVSPVLSDVTISAPTPVNRPPVAVCRNLTLPADASCKACGSVDAGSYDPDANDPITCVPSASCPFGLGTTSVVLTCTDSHGIWASSPGRVAGVPSPPPPLPSRATQLRPCRRGGANASYGRAPGGDTCGGVTIQCPPAQGASLPLGATAGSCTAVDG